MDENTPPHTHHRSWVVAITCSTLVLLVFAGGLFALRDQMLSATRNEARQQTLEREKLASRLDTLQSALDALSSQPKPENGPEIAAITARLAEATDKLGALNNRIETVEKKLDEKKPEPVVMAPTPTPVAAPIAPAPSADSSALKLAVLSGKPYADALDAYAKIHPDAAKRVAPLVSFATTGVPSESDLMRELVDLLDTKQQPATIDDTSMVGKINTHLKGLVSIRKTTQDDPLAMLRKQATRDDLPTVAREVAQLDMPAESPLGQWLKKARDRRDALAALDTLTPTPGE